MFSAARSLSMTSLASLALLMPAGCAADGDGSSVDAGKPEAGESGGAGSAAAGGNGGEPATGGHAGGGLPATGGVTGGGGAPASGGSPASGGAQATGGSSAAGGADAGPDGSAGGGAAGDRCDAALLVPGKPPAVLAMTGDLGTHDPAVIEADGIFYQVQTGPGLPVKRSTNLSAWQGAPAAFAGGNPAWIKSQVPAATDLWAPDLSYFGGAYHLYYSASSFGVNTSCIGHATRANMASGAWTDHGPVVCSSSSDNYNAIDPNVVLDQNGTPWLAFGSFWSGIKMARLNDDGSRADDALHSIASRGGGAIEAPFVVRRCGYYYLFVSFDRCCAGAQSTYNVRVGRSESVLGPYVDRDGTPMMNGGGTLVVRGAAGFAAAGHNAVIFTGDRAYNVFHAYPTNGSYARLRVAELAWDEDGWPVSGGP